jgi:type IV pilus assembly protein PilC
MAFRLDNLPREKKPYQWDLHRLLQTEINGFGKAFGTKKKEAFYTELSLLLTAGVSLKDALSLLATEQKKQADQVLLKNLVQALIRGARFSEALSEHSVFTNYEYYSLKIGESTGDLQRVCRKLGVYFKNRNEQKKAIINALSYPAVVLLTAFLAIAFMLQFVVPMFAEIFKLNKVDLPTLTKGIIAISEFFADTYPLFLVVLVFLTLGIKVLSKKDSFQKTSSILLLKIPFVGPLVQKTYLVQFTQATSLLLGADVPMLNCIQLTQKMIAFYPIRTALKEIEPQLLAGVTLSKSLEKFPVFDSKMRSLVKVAEETHEYPFIFDRLNEQYSEEVTQQSKMLRTFLEPLLIVFLGVVVALVLIAMYMPMFQLSSAIV